MTAETECIKPDPGYVADRPGQRDQTPCPAGKYANDDRTACDDCPPATFSEVTGGTLAACLPCSDNPSVTSYYTSATGLASRGECQCAADWTGSNCELSDCADLLDPVSLGLLVIEAGYPEELRPGKDLGSNALVAVRSQVEAILRTADTDGNDRLSAAEGVAAAGLLDMVLNPTAFTDRIWAQPRTPEIEPQLTFPFGVTPSTFTDCVDACQNLGKGMLCPDNDLHDLAYETIAVASGIPQDTGLWTGLRQEFFVQRGWVKPGAFSVDPSAEIKFEFRDDFILIF